MTTAAGQGRAGDPGPVFAALAHPGRRRMLQLTQDGERPAGELARRCGFSRPAASQHLRVLRDAGLVEVRVRGNERLYRARSEWVAGVQEFVDGFWAHRLDALRAALAAEEQT